MVLVLDILRHMCQFNCWAAIQQTESIDVHSISIYMKIYFHKEIRYDSMRLLCSAVAGSATVGHLCRVISRFLFRFFASFAFALSSRWFISLLRFEERFQSFSIVGVVGVNVCYWTGVCAHISTFYTLLQRNNYSSAVGRRLIVSIGIQQFTNSKQQFFIWFRCIMAKVSTNMNN